MAEHDWLQMLGQLIQPGGTAGWLQRQDAARPQSPDTPALKYPGDEISAVPMGMSDPMSVLASLFTPQGMKILQELRARQPIPMPKIFGSQRGSLEDLRKAHTQRVSEHAQQQEPPTPPRMSLQEKLRFEKEHPHLSETELEAYFNSLEAPNFHEHRLNAKSEGGDYGDFAQLTRDRFLQRLERGETLSSHDQQMLKTMEDFIRQHQLDEPF